MKPRAYRSPRCDTCRRRKVKCDYQRPKCMRCIRSGIRCEGYPRDLVFIPCTYTSASAESTRETQHEFGHHDPRRIDQETQRNHSQRMNTPIRVINPGSIHRDVFSCFLDQYAPKRSTFLHYSLQWMETQNTIEDRFRTLHLASSALGTVVLARSNDDKELLADGMHLYGNVMSSLRRAQLTNSTWMGILMTIITLQIYEAVESSAASGDGWMRHAVGICSILSNVGPTAFQEGSAHDVFLCCRLSLVMGSIQFEKPTMLAGHEWRSIPWEKRAKNELHRLLDILVHIPTLLQAANELSRTNERKSARSHQQELTIFHRLRKHLEDSLDRWLAELTENRNKPLFWTRPPGNNVSTGDIFAEELCFSDLPDSQILNLYWEAKLRCHSAAQRVAKKEISECRQTETAASPAEPPVDSLISYADKICQSVNFMQSVDFGILGLHFAMFPTMAALRFYTESGLLDRQAWCSSLLDRMSLRPFSILSRYDVPTNLD